MKKLIFIALMMIVGVVLVSGCAQRTPEETNYLIKLKKDCQAPIDKEYSIPLETPNYRFIVLNLTRKEVFGLRRDKCVVRISTAAEARERFEELSPEVKDAIKKMIRRHHLGKSVLWKDIIDRERLLEILREEQPTLPGGIISHYQLYVTPDSVPIIELATSKSPDSIYRESVGWVWVSEQTLNKEVEKWLYPDEFLVETPTFSTNPIPGRIVSDCSEQANTLVSLLRATDMPPEEVRVVLGKVDFDGEIGGHAWVQVFDDGLWVDLDSTSGPYWDDDAGRLVQSDGISWDYFKFFPYPVIETWVYYNDQYFYDLETKQGNAPSSWYR